MSCGHSEAPTSNQVCARQELDQNVNFKVYFVYLAIVITTVVAVRMFDKTRRALRPSPRVQPEQAEPRQRKQFRDVASQAQTTYTAVRGVSEPRFQVLPEFSQG